jgi:hypothetical protein
MSFGKIQRLVVRAGERLEVAHDDADTRAPLAGTLELAPHPRRLLALVAVVGEIGEAANHEIEARDDVGERIVDLMRDARR